jgi:integrase/recombinase XerC
MPGEPGKAASHLVHQSHGEANRLVTEYRTHLAGRANHRRPGERLSAATIATRIKALRSMVTRARQQGLISWALDVALPKAKPYRDTRGPGEDGYARMLVLAKRRAAHTPKGKRDLAILLLLRDRALRRGEVVGLDLADVELGDEAKAHIVGKGHTEREPVTLGPFARAALLDWLTVRGTETGPLFVRMDRAAGHLERIDGRAVERMVAELGRAALGPDAKVKPHGLRHAGITAALDRTGGDIRAARKFSRHANPATVIIYDDSRIDEGGRIAALLDSESAAVRG